MRNEAKCLTRSECQTVGDHYIYENSLRARCLTVQECSEIESPEGTSGHVFAAIGECLIDDVEMEHVQLHSESGTYHCAADYPYLIADSGIKCVTKAECSADRYVFDESGVKLCLSKM